MLAKLKNKLSSTESPVENLDTEPVEEPSTGLFSNLIGATITVGVALMIMVLLMLVVGYFVAEVPANGTYAEQINQTVDIGGTAFIILGVSLLAVPVVAVVGLFYSGGLGGFINR